MAERDLTSTSPRFNRSWVLAGIVVAFTAYGVLLFWYLADRVPEFIGPVTAGAWIIQAHLFAIWAALGPGKFLLRLPPVVATLLTVLCAPAVHPDGEFERGEFVAIALTGTSIFAITTALLLIMRRFVCWQIEYPGSSSPSDYLRYRFSTWYLMVVVTLYAIALGVYTNIVYKQPDPPPPFNLFGPGFVIAVIVYGGATAAILLWPIIAVPLFVLSAPPSKRGVIVALTFWAIITAALTTVWHVMDDGAGSEILLGATLLQAGAVVTGLLTAIPLRLAGYRLVCVKRNRGSSANITAE